MSLDVGIVDYGVGNLRSLFNALNTLEKVKPVISSSPETLKSCEKLILPGVGAFPKGMELLRQKGLNDLVVELLEEGRWILGICLGMQMLANSSSELGGAQGLGLIPGRVEKLPITPSEEIKLPHICWNKITPCIDHSLFRGMDKEHLQAYFVHSYAFCPEEKEHTLSTTTYAGHLFVSGVSKDTLIGLQFHPEKSGPKGLQLLQNFINS